MNRLVRDEGTSISLCRGHVRVSFYGSPCVPDVFAVEQHTLAVLVGAHVLVIAFAWARRAASTCTGTGPVADLVLTTSATSLRSSCERGLLSQSAKA